MESLRLTLVVVENNDYQAMQVAAAQEAAERLNVALDVIEIEHDAVMQSQEIIKALQNPPESRPQGVLFEPVGTSLTQAARLAATAGIGWVVLNRASVEYMHELRSKHKSPLMCVTTSHVDVGKLQGEQLAKLLPNGGTVLYIQGPSSNDASVERTQGMESSKPANIDLRLLKGTWTEISGYQAVSSFLRLSTSREAMISAVAAQNDAMALGARRAFQELMTGADKERYSRIPFLGCDGLKNFGQAAVKKRELAATVVIPASAGEAVEALVDALRSKQQGPERIYTQPTSFPDLGSLRPVALS